jgi:hypothetical protein
MSPSKAARLLAVSLIAIPLISSSSVAQERPEDVAVFYAQSSVEFLANQLPRGTSLGNPGRDSRDFEAHLAWARRQDGEVLRRELIEKFNRLAQIKAESGQEALADWYAQVCTHWSQFNVDFGNPGTNSTDPEQHFRWAVSQPVDVIRQQLQMRVEMIIDSYRVPRATHTDVQIQKEPMTQRVESWDEVEKHRPEMTSVEPKHLEVNAPCFSDPGTVVGRVPVEKGKKAYIWPDDGQGTGKTLLEFVRTNIRNGDTLYIRAGESKGSIVTSKIIKPKTGVKGPPMPPVPSFSLERVHIRGAGANKTVIKGHISVGQNSTIENLTIDNRGQHKHLTSIEVDPPGALIENVIIKGGSSGIRVGNAIHTGVSGKVIIECVALENVMSNGIYLGDDRSSNIVDPEIRRVSIKGTGNVGLAVFGPNARIDALKLDQIGTNGFDIEGNNAELVNVAVSGTQTMGGMIKGDDASVRNLSMTNIGTGGLSIEGKRGRIHESIFKDISLFAIVVNGGNPVISKATIQKVGTTSDGSGIIIYHKSNNFSVENSLLDSVRIGILIKGAKGQQINNKFTNIFFKNVQVSSAPPW